MHIMRCLYRVQAYNHLDVVGPCYNKGSCDTKIPSLYKEIRHKCMFCSIHCIILVVVACRLKGIGLWSSRLSPGHGGHSLMGGIEENVRVLEFGCTLVYCR